MRLSTLIVFTASALWAFASPIYGQRSESALRRRNPTLASQAHTDQLSQSNAHISCKYQLGGHWIYVTGFDGEPVRTYIVDSDGKQYIVIYHSHRHTSDTIMHQNHDGKQETYVLKQNNGLRTYTVNLDGTVLESHDPNVHIITYSHEVNGRETRLEIGLGGQPMKTVIRHPSGQIFTFQPTEKSHRMDATAGQPLTDVALQPLYNAHISRSWHGGKHRIFVTAFDGKPLRTYIVDANEEQYVVINHSHQSSTRYVVMSYNTLVGLEVTQVLGPDGLRGSMVDHGGVSRQDPLKIDQHTIKYQDDFSGSWTTYFRDIGHLGQPVKTKISYHNGQVRSFEPTLRAIAAADQLSGTVG